MFKIFTVAVVAFCLLNAAPSLSIAQAVTVFEGTPQIKISEGGTERVVQPLAREQAVPLACVISEIDGKYYWASRQNKQLVRIIAGAFVTYLAVDGAGYVRIFAADAKLNQLPTRR